MTRKKVRLVRREGQVLAYVGDDENAVPVKLVWARPVSAREGAVCLMGKDKKEVAMLAALDELDADSRKVATEELGGRYLIPRITRVVHTRANFGVRYWHVETDLGERKFALKHATKNAVWIDEDHLVLRDTMGCRYEIRPYSALDAHSRAEVEKVL